MSQAAEAIPISEPLGRDGRLIVGRVVDGGHPDWVVDLGERRLVTRRARGCLIDPAHGDIVLVATLNEEAASGPRGWLLTVLDREGEAASRLSAEGDLEVVAPQGKVRIQAKEGIALGTPGATRLTSGTFELVALSTKLLTRQLHALGERAKSEITKVEVVAETVDTVAERLRQKAKRAFRMIEGLDQLRAGNIDSRARGFSRSHAADQVVTADGLIKVDGKQVHIG